jgi:uncharacterized protein (TIGR02246 family)
MNMPLRSSLLTAATLLATYAALGQTSQDVKTKEVPEFLRQLANARQTIADGYVRLVEAIKAKDIGAVVGLYADDATILPIDGGPVIGKDAVRAYYKELYANQDKLVEQKFENINSLQSGDLFIDSTSFSGVLLRDGKEIRFQGKRLVVWKREFQGPWKISRDIWNRSSANDQGLATNN